MKNGIHEISAMSGEWRKGACDVILLGGVSVNEADVLADGESFSSECASEFIGVGECPLGEVVDEAAISPWFSPEERFPRKVDSVRAASVVECVFGDFDLSL